MKKIWDKLNSVLRLSFSLAKAEFKLRNEGSYLGIVWYLLEPLFIFLILIFIFGGRSNNIPHYPLYLLFGLVMFNFFSSATRESTNVIMNNSSFIKSRKLNYASLVISRVLRSMYSHVFEIIIVLIFMVYYKIPLIGILAYPPLLFLFSIFSLGIGLFLAAIGVYVNDLINVWRVFLRGIWFAVPIFYAIGESSLQFLINPITHFIHAGRLIVINHQQPSSYVILSILITPIISLVIGGLIFNKLKGKFAEKV